MAKLPFINLEETGVSNAVPWSFLSKTQANLNPWADAIEKAADFWKDILDVLSGELRHIIVFGPMARGMEVVSRGAILVALGRGLSPAKQYGRHKAARYAVLETEHINRD